MRDFLRKAVLVAVALALAVRTGFLTARPSASGAEIHQLASRFGFTRVPLNTAPVPARTQRAVAPALEPIRAWISAVGAAVALTDLRGLGRSADACLVDPRNDSVTVFGVPGAGGPAYPAFPLALTTLAHDSTMA